MYYGLHQWTATHTAGIIDARFIAILNTALESPLGQISMIPLLAWIAKNAPDELKATFLRYLHLLPTSRCQRVPWQRNISIKYLRYRGKLLISPLNRSQQLRTILSWGFH